MAAIRAAVTTSTTANAWWRMSRCGICWQRYGELMVKHAELCEDDSKAPVRPYGPEIDDLIRMEEESNG